MLQIIRKFPGRKRLDKQSFFLASPGDLGGERGELRNRLLHDLEWQGYDLYAYEYDPDLNFHSAEPAQGQIPYSSDPLANVTICLLGEKLGSGVGDAFKLPEGFERWLTDWQKRLGSPIALPHQNIRRGEPKIPLTGTLFELLDALRAAKPGSGREVWVFVKGRPHTLPKENWSTNRSLGKIDLVRNYGLNAYHTRLTDLAAKPSSETQEAQAYLRKEYDDQLSYVDAVLRILREKSLLVDWFENTQDLIEKVSRKTRTYFKGRTPAHGVPWAPSLEPIDSQHSHSLFGRRGDVLSICNDLIRLSLPETEPGRPWYVLPGISGSGKSSIAGGVAARFLARFHKLEVVTLETSPSDLHQDATHPPVIELARRIRTKLDNQGFPTRDEQECWDRCIAQGRQARPDEVAALVVSLVRAASPSKQRFVLLVIDQAEEWWDADGNFLEENRAMLVFLDHLTRSKAIWCLTLLQSEPTDGGQGGRRQSLLLIKEFPSSTAEIAAPLAPPSSARIREIINGIVKEQVGVVPEALETLVDSVSLLQDIPFLPLLALRLKRICDAFRAQSLTAASAPTPGQRIDAPKEPHHGVNDDPFRDAGTEKVRFAVTPWMTESILGELDALGEAAVAEVGPLLGDTHALDAALDLCMTKLIDVGISVAGTRPSDRCILREALPGDFGAADTPEQLLFESLKRHRMIRYVAKRVRLAHISVVDHWARARDWSDKTATRRNAMKRIAAIIAQDNVPAAIAANLESAENWTALRQILHHIANNSPLVPEKITERRAALVEGFTIGFGALRDNIAAQNDRLNLALDVGFDELVDRVLAAEGVMAALDADISSHGTEPLLIRLARAGRLDLVVRGAKQGCRRTARSPQTSDTVFSLILHRIDHNEANALGTFSILLDGDPSDRVEGKLRPRPLNHTERAEILAARTEHEPHSLLDHAATSGSPKAIRLVWSLVPDVGARKKLLDPLTARATRGLASPLFLAVASGKQAAAKEILREAKRLLGKKGLRKYVNSMPVRSVLLQRREPPIVAAARNRNAEMVRLLLDHGADPTKAASDLSDAFQAALLNDDTHVLAVLLATPFRPPLSGAGFALGHWAAVLNAKACLAMLARLKGKTWTRDTLGRTPLHIACARSQLDVVKVLLDSLPAAEGARQLAAYDNRGRNALATALSAGRLDVSEHLLGIESVARSVNSPDPEGYRPLHYAIRFCGLEGISLLRAKGSETEFALEGNAQITTLQIAALINDVAACELLLNERSLAQVNPHRRTALHYAARYGSTPTLEKLLAAPNAPVHAVNTEGQTALHLTAFHGHEPCVALLLQKDASNDFVNAVDKETSPTQRGGRTALWSASSGGHPNVVKLLVAHGADIEHRSANHLRPIDEACRRGKAAAVRALLEEGARWEPGWLNFTPLHYACRGGHIDCFDELVRWMEDREGPNALTRAMAARTQFGDTPLQLLGKALVRATRPRLLARSAADDDEFGPDDNSEIIDPAERADERLPNGQVVAQQAEAIDERPWDETAAAANFDPVGASRIVKKALAVSRDALDEDTLNAVAIGSAMLGDLDLLETCRKAGVRFDAIRDQFGATPLHLAAKASALGVLEALVGAGADINASAADGTRPFHNIVLHASADALRQALGLFAKKGGDLREIVNAHDVFGETPLHKLAACKSIDLLEKLEILSKAGADINQTNADGETPRGVLAFVRRRLASTTQDDLKTEIEVLDAEMKELGGRVVERPASEPRLPRVGFPLHGAIAAGRWELVPKIKRYAPDFCLTAPDPNGRTPLMALASADWSADAQDAASLFEWLLSKSAAVNACDATGRTVAHYACMATQRERKNLVVGSDSALRRLPQAAVLSARDGLGRTPLHVAAAAGNDAAVRWLLEQGQDAGAVDELDNAPAHLAAQHGHWKAFDLLIEHQGDRQPAENAVGLTPSAIRMKKAQAFAETANACHPSARRSPEPKQRRATTWIALGVLTATAVAAAGALWVLGPDAFFSLLPSR